MGVPCKLVDAVVGVFPLSNRISSPKCHKQTVKIPEMNLRAEDRCYSVSLHPGEGEECRVGESVRTVSSVCEDEGNSGRPTYVSMLVCKFWWPGRV